jgi:PEP-CTERM motif
MNAIRISFVVAMALASSAITAQAGSITYDLTYSGASFGDSAVGTGTVTIDTSLLNNPGSTDTATSPFVDAFAITISGATSGNGTFGMADFAGFALDTNDATLNLTTQLVGQTTPNGEWGVGDSGNFRFAINDNDPSAPATTFGQFIIGTNGGQGDRLRLTSFVPEITSVPEPSTLTMLGIAATCLAAAAYRRRRRLA